MFLIIISEPNEDILIFYSNVIIMLKFLSEILFLLLPILISS